VLEIPETRYARSGDVNIAYQVLGEGPEDLVFIPGFISNLDVAWDLPQLAELYRRLASFSRLIVFDKRGSGLSDRDVGIPPLEVRMDDVRAVMDAAGSARAALLGVSEGGPLTLLFAATYPQRTTAAVLYGTTGARRLWAPDYPFGEPRAELERSIEAAEKTFGSTAYLERTMTWLAPSLVGDVDFERWVGRFLRQGGSPGAVAALSRMNMETDVRHVLGAISVPMLLVHRVDDEEPIEHSRYVADRVPGAQLVELPGRDHAFFVNPEQILDVVEPFLRDVWAERAWEEAEPDRVLATVLFTDIVGSTAKAVELGDSRWRELVQRHHALIRQRLARFRGTEIDTAGDGFFASFDGPARAIRCACAISKAVGELGLEVRAGLHTGECELVDGKVGGIAVHIGARVAAAAAPGEVLVSSTVRDLVAGSELEFEERGTAELKGIPGEWPLYAVRA
jgi:class 3 adenylate cyclase/pimeloyl-ACP methyl ester carboxylesterase